MAQINQYPHGWNQKALIVHQMQIRREWITPLFGINGGDGGQSLRNFFDGAGLVQRRTMISQVANSLPVFQVARAVLPSAPPVNPLRLNVSWRTFGADQAHSWRTSATHQSMHHAGGVLPCMHDMFDSFQSANVSNDMVAYR